jgi:acyl-CoA hydrolase
MSTRKEPKVVSSAEAAAIVRSGDWLDYGFGLGQPDLFDRALAQRRDELRGVKIRSGHTLRERAVVECDPEGGSFAWLSWHFSGYDRHKADEGRAVYIPMNFGEAPDYYRRFIEPVDVVCIKTAPMDEHGCFNFGGAVSYHRALTERAKVLIVETCPAMPYAFGIQESVHRSEVDFIIESADGTVPEMPNRPASDIDRKVAAFIASELTDGACLQVGVGAMPNAVCSLIGETGARDLGVHSEMLVDGIIDLIEKGLVTGARKNIDLHKAVFTFAAGSRRQYDFLNRNPLVWACPVDYTNLPENISRNDRVFSINNTTRIDLQGQCASESCGYRHLTGTGGQLQFVRGAYASRGGKSFICLASTYDRRGTVQSRIVPSLEPGDIVTTPRTDVMFVVTEYGMVNLKGRSVPERARALISIAHPQFREQLERAAREHRIIPHAF